MVKTQEYTSQFLKASYLPQKDAQKLMSKYGYSYDPKLSRMDTKVFISPEGKLKNPWVAWLFVNGCWLWHRLVPSTVDVRVKLSLSVCMGWRLFFLFFFLSWLLLGGIFFCSVGGAPFSWRLTGILLQDLSCRQLAIFGFFFLLFFLILLHLQLSLGGAGQLLADWGLR
jgi:hypothetical protein